MHLRRNVFPLVFSCLAATSSAYAQTIEINNNNSDRKNSEKTLEERCEIDPNDMITVHVDPQEVGLVEKGSSEELKIISLAQSPYEVLQKAISTPREAGIYSTRCLSHGGKDFDNDNYGGDFWMSGRQIHMLKIGDCDDGAMSSVSNLKDDGFPPYVLVVYGRTQIVGGSPFTGHTAINGVKFGHAIHIYKTDEGKFGSIGMNEKDIVVPEAKTIEEFLEIWSGQTGDIYDSWKIYDVSVVEPDYDVNRENNSPLRK